MFGLRCHKLWMIRRRVGVTLVISSRLGDGVSGRNSWISDEHELVVMIPAAFLRVHARLELGGGRAAGRARSTTSGHVEPLFLEHVERLFDRRVFQKEPAQQYNTTQLVSTVNNHTYNNLLSSCRPCATTSWKKKTFSKTHFSDGLSTKNEISISFYAAPL